MNNAVRFLRGTLKALLENATSAAAVALYSKPPPDLRQLRTDRADECVIIGNGPSLRESLTAHPELLANREIICTNYFLDTDFFFQLQPRYYVFADPTIWSRSASARFEELFRRYNQLFRERVSWPLIIFMPVAARDWNYFVDVPQANSNVRIVYVNTTQVNGSQRLRHWLFRRNLAMPTMHSVLVTAIFIALNMGYRLSVILGGDNSWIKNLHVGDDNRLYVVYDRADLTAAPKPAPFFEDPEETRPYTMQGFLSWQEKVFRGYQELAAYAKSRGVRVINATPGSFIDAFERWRAPRLP